MREEIERERERERGGGGELNSEISINPLYVWSLN